VAESAEYFLFTDACPRRAAAFRFGSFGR
jgi:hypothetical protein